MDWSQHKNTLQVQYRDRTRCPEEKASSVGMPKHFEFKVILSQLLWPRWYLSGSNYIWMTRKGNMKVADTSSTIKRSRTAMPPDRGTADEVGIPRIVLRDIIIVLQSLRPDSKNLPCLYSTFHIEYPLVLSRFSFHLPFVMTGVPLCPKSPSARGLVACLPVRLLFKSTKHNVFYPV